MKNDQYANFDRTASVLLKVPHSEIKAKLEEEKKSKKRKNPKNSYASREAGDKV